MRFLGSGTLMVLTLCLAAGVADAQDPNHILNFSENVSGPLGGQADTITMLDHPNGTPIAGWSWGVCQDSLVNIVAVNDGETVIMIDPAFIAPNVIDGEGWTIGVVVDFFGMVFLQPADDNELHIATYDLLAVGIATINYCDTLGTPLVETVLVDNTGGSIIPTQEVGNIEVIVGTPIFLRAGDAVDVPAGTLVTIGVTLDNEADDVEGFSFGLAHDGTLVDLTALEVGAVVAGSNGGMGPAFFGPIISPGGADGGTVGCVISLSPPFDQIPMGIDNEIVLATYMVDNNAPDGSSTSLDFVDTLGNPPVGVVVTVNAQSVTPVLDSGSIGIVVIPFTPFRRGDVNNDSDVDISDAVGIAEALFGGPTGFMLTCDDAADTDDNGVLEPLPDTVFLLNFLFLMGPPVPAPDPFGPCGADPTDMDGIDCETYNGMCP